LANLSLLAFTTTGSVTSASLFVGVEEDSVLFSLLSIVIISDLSVATLRSRSITSLFSFDFLFLVSSPLAKNNHDIDSKRVEEIHIPNRHTIMRTGCYKYDRLQQKREEFKSIDQDHEVGEKLKEIKSE